MLRKEEIKNTAWDERVTVIGQFFGLQGKKIKIVIHISFF